MNRKLPVFIAAPVLVAGVVIGAAGTASAGLPSAARHLDVHANETWVNVDGHLHPAASIAGTITAQATGQPLQARVVIYLNGKEVNEVYSDPSGKYLFGGLAGSATGYAVCVPGSDVYDTSGVGTGYLGRCFETAYFNGSTVPPTATPVTLTSGQAKTGVDIALPSGAAIAGRVTSPSGTALRHLAVYAHNRSSGATFSAGTDATGHYKVTGLTTSGNGYTVCFDPFGLTSGTGLLARCYKNVPWTVGAGYPPTAQKVAVTLGETHSGIDTSLPRGGGIAGTVTDAQTGKPVQQTTVDAFTSSGRFLASAGTGATGRYRITGLPAARADRVCVHEANPGPGVTYHGQCWKNVPWNGGKRPTGTTGIRVRLGHMHTGIRFALRKTTIALGWIAGTITERAGGHPLRNAFVTVYTSRGTYTNSGTTNRYGKYKVRYMPASSTGYLVCVDARYAHASIPTPTTGWAPRCYKDAAWNGIAKPPSTATHVTLTPGQHKTGVNIRLRLGGAVSGTVDAFNGPPLADVWVQVFTPSGVGVAETQSGSNGTYTIPSLSPATYVVCFDGRFLDGAAYRPQCYDNVPWSGSG